MRKNETPETDSAASVTPPIRHTVPWRVVSAKPLRGLRLKVVFVDGTEGRVEMKAFLADSKVDGTPFEPLRDPAVFRQVTLHLGAVTWPSGAEFAPDTMYDAIKEHGQWVVGV